MTSRYTDTQLLLCVYVHLWVCVWVYKEQWDHRKQNFPSEGPLGGLTRQRLASERALGDSVGRHTHTNLIKVSRLFSSGAGWVPMLSAAWGSLRSCECLLESKFVKSWCLNGHSGWEASPPSSPLVIRAETNDSLVTHTHTHSIHAYTHPLARWTSCDSSKGAAWFSSPGQISLFYVHFPFSPVHAVATTLEAGAEQNKSLNTLREGHGQSVHRNPPAPAHKDVTPLTRLDVKTTVCKFW